jgi:hypothetical protein
MANALTIRGIWGGMSDEVAATVLADVRRESPDTYRGAVNTAAAAFRMRPDAFRQQPLPRQAATIRRALTQVNQQEQGALILIEWLTKTQKPMLTQFLDALEIAHEDGTIKDEISPEPDEEKLAAAIAGLRASFPPEQVRVYLQAFSVITADEWQHLPALIDAEVSTPTG